MRLYRIRNLVNGKVYVGQTTHKELSRHFEGHSKAAEGSVPLILDSNFWRTRTAGSGLRTESGYVGAR